MKVVFLGAYFNHHQKPLSDALADRCEYTYIATTKMPEMRVKLGYGGNAEPEYVCRYDEDRERAEKSLRDADVVLTGSAPEKLVRQCIRRSQPVFRYAERPLKKGEQWHKYLPRLVKWHWQNPPGKPIYMLCASAYTASDYRKFGLFRNRAFRWGYFPETRWYEDAALLQKQKPSASLLWVGRFLDWKHPDEVIRAAANLKADGLKFTLDFIGTGEQEEKLRSMVTESELEDCVRFLGAMKPEQVRERMEKAEIFLFTSDRKEGWGAVVNEAMNSGCAVVASDAAGSSPYLIRHGKNGLLYPSGNAEVLQASIRQLLEEPKTTARLGANAYRTIQEEWNAEAAAQRFLEMAEAVLEGRDLGSLFQTGPGSPDAGKRKEGL